MSKPLAHPAFNPFSAEMIATPELAYRKLLADDAALWDPTLHAWVLSRMDHVRAVMEDTSFRAAPASAILGEIARRTGRDFSALIKFLDAVMFFMNGPRHERDRRSVAKVMNRMRLSEMEPVLVRIAQDLAAPIRARGHCDAVPDFADPFPQMVMAHILGLPAEDVPTLTSLLGDVTLIFEPTTFATYERLEALTKGALSLLAARIEEAVRTDADCGLRQLYEGAEGSGSERFMNAAATTAFVYRVGSETTIGLIGLLIRTLVQQPELRDAIKADPSLTDVFVAEVLRLNSNVQRSTRVATEARELDGVSIAAGDRVLLLIGAANRDPRTFTVPERVSLDAGHPADLGFGAGKHFCLGASLARLEGRVAVQTFLDLPPFELSGEEHWYASRIIRRLISLKLRAVT